MSKKMVLPMSVEPDPFTDFVIKKIDPGIYQSLTLEQRESIIAAIGASAPFARHPVDLRGVIPLFFIRFYFVILIGRDRRDRTHSRESRRRSLADIIVGLVLVVAVLLPLFVLLLFTLYLVKTEMGIDLFPEHLGDLLRP